MSAPSSAIRTYRWLGCVALAHALALVGLLALLDKLQHGLVDQHLLCRSLWVGLVTLWFLWLPVLLLHRGRSLLRFGLFLSLSVVFLFPSCRFYDVVGPSTLGLPKGVYSMNPIFIGEYYWAYWAGHREATKDVAAGILAIEEYGFGAGSDMQILRERCHIEIRPTAACLVNETILGHAAGYNAVSEAEIDRRVGRAAVDAAREEGNQLAVEQRARDEQYYKDLTNRVSRSSSHSKIVLESVKPFLDGHVQLEPDAEQELGQFVREIERFVSDAVPEDAPAFDLHVSATLTPTERPEFQTSASLSSPQLVYDRIHQNLPSLPLPQWKQGRLVVALDFKIREIR